MRLKSVHKSSPEEAYDCLSQGGDVSAMIVPCRIRIRTHVGNSQGDLRGGYNDSSLQKNVDSSGRVLDCSRCWRGDNGY